MSAHFIQEKSQDPCLCIRVHGSDSQNPCHFFFYYLSFECILITCKIEMVKKIQLETFSMIVNQSKLTEI